MTTLKQDNCLTRKLIFTRDPNNGTMSCVAPTWDWWWHPVLSWSQSPVMNINIISFNCRSVTPQWSALLSSAQLSSAQLSSWLDVVNWRKLCDQCNTMLLNLVILTFLYKIGKTSSSIYCVFTKCFSRSRLHHLSHESRRFRGDSVQFLWRFHNMFHAVW